MGNVDTHSPLCYQYQSTSNDDDPATEEEIDNRNMMNGEAMLLTLVVLVVVGWMINEEGLQPNARDWTKRCSNTNCTTTEEPTGRRGNFAVDNKYSRQSNNKLQQQTREYVHGSHYLHLLYCFHVDRFDWQHERSNYNIQFEKQMWSKFLDYKLYFLGIVGI